MIRFLCSTILLLCSCFLSSCSIGYISEAAWVQAGILFNRKPLEKVIEDPKSSEIQKNKLKLVKEILEYASSQNFNVGGAYSTYSEIDKGPLNWVLVGSKPEAFELKEWWFPIVGRVPYLGFFNKEKAETTEKELKNEGLETWLRGADAISTLGWFDDPVLSTMLSYKDPALAALIFHELSHRTVWIRDDVVFNESFANVIGYRTAIEFFKMRLASCRDPQCLEENYQLLEAARAQWAFEQKLGETLNDLYDSLDKLYRSKSSKSEILLIRNQIFNEKIKAIRDLFPDTPYFKEINNAEIYQLRIYLGYINEVSEALNSINSIPEMFRVVSKNSDRCEANASVSCLLKGDGVE